MDNIIIMQRFFGGHYYKYLKCCSVEPQVLKNCEEINGTFSNLQFLILATLKDTIFEGGSIFLAFLAVGCVGLVMFYIVNGIYVLSYILIQLLVGDGTPTFSSNNKNLIYHLIYDQILLHRLWKRPTPSKSSPIKFSNGNRDYRREYHLKEKSRLMELIRNRNNQSILK